MAGGTSMLRGIVLLGGVILASGLVLAEDAPKPKVVYKHGPDSEEQ